MSRRVKVALADNYLQNLEPRKGQAMKLVSADPLPEAQRLLPDPATLEERCTVALLREGMNTPPPLDSHGSRDEEDDAGLFYFVTSAEASPPIGRPW